MLRAVNDQSLTTRVWIVSKRTEWLEHWAGLPRRRFRRISGVSAPTLDGISAMQREYQEYVIAHRVRKLLGKRLEPRALLSLTQYAVRRLERQRLARELITVKPLTAERMMRLDAFTDELCFGMWRNPREINDFLSSVWRIGGHVIFESEPEFAAQVLTDAERERLPERGLEIARFYSACLRVGPAAMNPEEMDFAVSRVETLALSLPIFIDELERVDLESADLELPDLSWLEG